MNERITLTEEVVDTLEEKVRPYYTEKRLKHTLSVAKEAVKLGEIYLPNEIQRLRAAALLHDITKIADQKKQLQYCEEFGIIIRCDDFVSPSVLHAITGAELAKRDFAEYIDEDIVSAVRWHTTGHKGMTKFEALIFLADYIEETRDFEDCVKLRRYFYDRIYCKDDPDTVLRDTMIYSFDLTISLLLKEGAIIDTDTIEARNDFVAHKKRA